MNQYINHSATIKGLYYQNKVACPDIRQATGACVISLMAVGSRVSVSEIYNHAELPGSAAFVIENINKEINIH